MLINQNHGIVVSCQIERDQIANFGVFNSFFCVNHKDDFISFKFFSFYTSKKSNNISFEKSDFSMPKFKVYLKNLI